MKEKVFTIFYDKLRNKDVNIAGGKNASLGELIQTLKKEGIKVPEGFATTSYSYWYFLKKNNLTSQYLFIDLFCFSQCFF